MGHPRKMQFTAIGDAVNTASRVESAVKVTHANLLISETVYDQVKDAVRVGAAVTTELKGKHGTYRLFEVTGIE
jgi:adenylate cyclase